jgi:nitrogenase molybdenum-iron protein alpha/beta subunit
MKHEASRAAAHGLDLGTYAASLLEEAAGVPVTSQKSGPSQLDATLRELAQYSQKIPQLPDDAFSGESI